MKSSVRYAAAFLVLFCIGIVFSIADAPPLRGSMHSESDASFWSGEVPLVNVNTATLEELCTLPQIGEKRAQAILEYREEHGPFSRVEEICEVDGISDGILSVIRNDITV